MTYRDEQGRAEGLYLNGNSAELANTGKCYLVGLAVTDDPASPARNTWNSAARQNTTL